MTSEADEIREHVVARLDALAKPHGALLAIRSGDVVRSMGLVNRTPSVCSVLKGHKFQQMAGLELVYREGPPQSTTTTYLYKQIGPGSLPVDASDSSQSTVLSTHKGTTDDHRNLAAMIAAGESATVEFKETLRKNTHTGENDSRMEDAVVKTIAGFLNTHGGILFVGVKDDGSVVGTDADRFPNEDKMKLHLQNLVNGRIRRSAWAAIHANFQDISGARVLVVECGKASSPAYVKKKGTHLETFYMRTNNATEELSGRELVDYVRGHFPSG